MRLIIFALLLLCFSAASAKPPRPLLWRVSDANNSVYLLGSMHKLKKSDYPLDSSVDKAFDDAEKVYFEVSPNEMNDPATPRKMLDLGLLNRDQTLKKRLSPEVWESLAEYCALNQIPVENFQRYKPWLVGLLIGSDQAKKSGLSGEFGLDRHFMNLAIRFHKDTGSFETLAEQISYFDLLSPEAQEQSLYETLKEAEDPQIFDRMHTLWRNADAEGIWKMISEEKKQSPHFFQEFIDDRNYTWLTEITDFLERNSEDDALVVVGSAHLLGNHGLVNLLTKKGYSVVRLP